MTVTPHRDPPGPAVDDRRALRRYRVAISALFGIAGAVLGAWTARMPAIQHHLQLSHSQLSIALLALAAGGLAGMRSAGRLVDRYGSAAVAIPTALILGPALAATAYVPSLPTLAAALLLLGSVHGLLNVSMNAAALTCQNAYQRPIMSGIHAWFSIGGALGAGAGAGCAHLQLSCPATYTAIGAAITVIAALAARRLAPPVQVVLSEPDPPAGARPSRHRGRILLLGALAACSLLCEGAIADWSSVYLDGIGATSTIAGAGYAAFAGAMTVGRLVGDRISARVKPVTLLRASGLLACAGMTTGLLTGTPAAAVAGYGLLGAGLAGIIPQIYTAAGTLDPDHPGSGLSRVAALGYAGFVVGPVLVGAAAMHVGLGQALLILPALAGLIAVAAPAVRGPRHTPAHRRIGTADRRLLGTLEPTPPQPPTRTHVRAEPDAVLIEVRLMVPACAVHGSPGRELAVTTRHPMTTTAMPTDREGWIS
ncbi:MFS transporter [Actinoplanes subtropicus]|uniref:MFS transporter n=1 Tax=Actinoplanes subtropicus TaxID=543632 RepID=UPI0007C5394C|nr:MFS transporter [Actinoplanes subtropicus]